MQITEAYESLWSKNISHAQLLLCNDLEKAKKLTLDFALLLLCPNTGPCKACQACELVMLDSHPDLNHISPEKDTGPIKIDQVRALQSLVYTSPQLGQCRIVVIHSAEKMNNSAANALLKLLEEPPNDVYFFLVANQVSTIPATIISRCQIWRMQDANYNYEDYGKNYSIESNTGKIFSDQHSILQDLYAISNQEQSICETAFKWTTYDFRALLSFLYVLNAQMIVCQLRIQKHTTLQPILNQLADHISLPKLFFQIDKINDILKKINRSISVNQLLAIEDLLLAYK